MYFEFWILKGATRKTDEPKGSTVAEKLQLGQHVESCPGEEEVSVRRATAGAARRSILLHDFPMISSRGCANLHQAIKSNQWNANGLQLRESSGRARALARAARHCHTTAVWRIFVRTCGPRVWSPKSTFEIQFDLADRNDFFHLEHKSASGIDEIPPALSAPRLRRLTV